MNDDLHLLLRRQLRRHPGLEEARSPTLDTFLTAVDAAYREFDTDRKLLERSLDLSSAELFRANADLRQTQRATMQQERLRALGQMASGVAHDINNAITPISMLTQLLLEEERGLSDDARNDLKMIRRAADDVAHTVSRLHEFYRRREPEPLLTPVQLEKMVPQALELTRARWNDMPQQRGNRIRVVTELADDLPPIMGSESDVRDALMNLIFNAVDAMPGGGTLSLRAVVRGTTVCIEVVDTGVGMDEQTREHCLEPFYTTKGERGTGLGLAMVYGMVQRHGAKIEVESALGGGTTIRLSFPATTGAEPAPKRASVMPAAALRLLVVDDDALLLQSMCRVLESDGHSVVAAAGGGQGIDALRAAEARGESFSAVITDLGMPEVDGWMVASTVKSISPVTPVIMLSGWGARLAQDGQPLPNVDALLSKPPRLDELRGLLARHCMPRIPTAERSRHREALAITTEDRSVPG